MDAIVVVVAILVIGVGEIVFPVTCRFGRTFDVGRSSFENLFESSLFHYCTYYGQIVHRLTVTCLFFFFAHFNYSVVFPYINPCKLLMFCVYFFSTDNFVGSSTPNQIEF